MTGITGHVEITQVNDGHGTRKEKKVNFRNKIDHASFTASSFFLDDLTASFNRTM